MEAWRQLWDPEAEAGAVGVGVSGVTSEDAGMRNAVAHLAGRAFLGGQADLGDSASREGPAEAAVAARDESAVLRQVDPAEGTVGLRGRVLEVPGPVRHLGRRHARAGVEVKDEVTSSRVREAREWNDPAGVARVLQQVRVLHLARVREEMRVIDDQPRPRLLDPLPDRRRDRPLLEEG